MATLPAPAGATTANLTQESVHLISEIHLYTCGGQYLCQLLNAPNYDAMVTPWNTSYDEFQSNDIIDRLTPSRATGLTTNLGGRSVGAPAASSPYTEQQYMRAGTLNGADPVMPFTIRLNRYKNTIHSKIQKLLLSETVAKTSVFCVFVKLRSKISGCFFVYS